MVVGESPAEDLAGGFEKQILGPGKMRLNEKPVVVNAIPRRPPDSGVTTSGRSVQRQHVIVHGVDLARRRSAIFPTFI